MFSVNPNQLYDFNYFAQELQRLHRQQQLQQAELERQRLLEQTSPKIIKKIETEDAYQIQIFKNYGTFESYEVKAVKNSLYPANSNIINLVIESEADNFRKIFQFNLNDIEVSKIDWEYYPGENVLVLNVPKKIKVCCDDLTNALFQGLFGINPAPVSYGYYQPQEAVRKAAEEQAKRDAEEASRREAAVRARKAAEEKAKQEAKEKARQEAELRARKEAELRARQIAEEEVRLAKEKARQAQEKAIQAQEKAKQAEIKARKVAEEKARRFAKLRAEKEDVKQQESKQREDYNAKLIQQQQEFINQLFGGNIMAPFFPYNPQFQSQRVNKEKVPAEPVSATEPVAQQAKELTTPEPKTKVSAEPVSATQAKELTTPEPKSPALSLSHSESDNESIESDAETSSGEEIVKILKPKEGKQNDSSLAPLHKHPSLEEVEDEEFVMFRKKFGK